MGMSRLADRELYRHGNAPTLVAQLDPDAALAEGRAALELSQTTFVAETSLPTKYGRFRVRAYRHSVRSHQQSLALSHISWRVLCGLDRISDNYVQLYHVVIPHETYRDEGTSQQCPG